MSECISSSSRNEKVRGRSPKSSKRKSSKSSYRKSRSHHRRLSPSRSRRHDNSSSPEHRRYRSRERHRSVERHRKRSHARSCSRSRNIDKKSHQHDESHKKLKSGSITLSDNTPRLSHEESVERYNKGTGDSNDKVRESIPFEQDNSENGSNINSFNSTVRQSAAHSGTSITIGIIDGIRSKVNCSKEVEEKVQQKIPTELDITSVDVSAIQQNIMKALAQARSAAAVIGISAKSTDQPEKSVESSNLLVNHSNTSGQIVTEEKAKSPATSIDSDVTNSAVQVKIFEEKCVANQKAENQQEMKAEVEVKNDDMFDMFSMSSIHVTARKIEAPKSLAANYPHLQSNWDDAEGYYKTVIGELIDNRYKVLGTIGKGVFSTVLKCLDINDPNGKVYAIKIVRNNDTMRKAAQQELQLLEELDQAEDKYGKKYIVKVLHHFEYRNHIILAFEPMNMNLREAMKKFGGKGGIQLKAVKTFAKQMLLALYHLQSCNIVHADIKPDNILVNEKNSHIKLCDFGSAFHFNSPDSLPTPYLVSRYYRAPEIILGFPYDFAVDLWSVGCCLYEMFTGKVLFPGSTNNEMLKLFMELRGRFHNKIIRRHRIAYVSTIEREPHFEEDCRFRHCENDRVTGKPVLRILTISEPTKNLGSMLLAAKSTTDDRKMINTFKDLLENMLALDPAKRISVKDALSHPFVKG